MAMAFVRHWSKKVIRHKNQTFSSSQRSTQTFRVGKWTPSDDKALGAFFDSMRDKATTQSGWDDVIENLKDVVEGDPVLKAHCDLMFSAVMPKPFL
jgi:hypothetical protein